jgi:DNA mismatch endonuclease, patch repair protein
MRAVRRVDTKPEILLRRAIHSRGLRFRKDLRLDLPDRRVRPDVVFTRIKLAVFVDGCFWHCCPQHGSYPKANFSYWQPRLDANVARDLLVNQSLRQAGWRVIRIWEHEPIEAAADKIQRAVAEAAAVFELSWCYLP